MCNSGWWDKLPAGSRSPSLRLEQFAGLAMGVAKADSLCGRDRRALHSTDEWLRAIEESSVDKRPGGRSAYVTGRYNECEEVIGREMRCGIRRSYCPTRPLPKNLFQQRSLSRLDCAEISGSFRPEKLTRIDTRPEYFLEQHAIVI